MGIRQTYPDRADLPSSHPTESFWHSKPSSSLLGFRSTANLPLTADVVIIGSGITGAFAAKWIRDDGVIRTDGDRPVEVVMLEAREVCWGATGRNGGHCQPMLYSSPPDIAAFELRNYETIKSLVYRWAIDCDWKSLPGCHTYMSEELFQDAVEQVDKLKKSAPGLAKYVKVVQKTDASPSLSDLRVPTAAGAVVQSTAASLWPYKLVCWILESLLTEQSKEAMAFSGGSHNGFKFNLQTTTPATAIAPQSNGTWLVQTPRGPIVTRHVLLTTNGYSSALVPGLADLIVPVRGEMSALTPPSTMAPDGPANPPLSHTYVFAGNLASNQHQDDYLVQRPFLDGGELMFGGARAHAANAGVGVSDDSAIDPPAAEYLRTQLSPMLEIGTTPPASELQAQNEWSGIMGYSRDGRPWVGELAESQGIEGAGFGGLFICAGYSGHGMPNACLSARAVVGMMGLRTQPLESKPEKKGGMFSFLSAKGSNPKDLNFDVDIPHMYRVSEKRVQEARQGADVKTTDASGNDYYTW